MLPNRIHIVGASGSGTTSLAAALSARHGHRHLDTDDFYWLPTDPPYREKRPVPDRLSLLRANAAVRAEYAELKADLMRRFPNDREAYTEGKSAFIRRVIDSAPSD